MGEAIVIASGKGGAGKSTLAVLLGAALSGAGRSVALVDMDMGMRSLDVMLGMENRIVYDLADVAEGVCRPRQALVRHASVEGLSLLAAAQTRDSGAITPRQAAAVVDRMRPHFDYVLLDCPAGVGRGFRTAVACADRGLIVSLIDPISLRDAERVAGLMERGDLPRPALVLNRVRFGQDVAAFEQRLNLRLTGLIPEERDLAGLMERDLARALNAPAGEAVRRIARRLQGEEVPLSPIRRPGLFARLREALFV